MESIWQILARSKKPFFAMAPLDDAGDTVFRQIISQVGKPDLFFTEFVSADAYARGGFDVVEQKLRFTDIERPIIAQIWGREPEHYQKLAAKIRQLGFDGVDLNMGCPEKNIVKNGCCSALICDPARAAEIIAATKEGASDLAVSVKTRIGFDRIVTEKWTEFLLKNGLAALTVHGRTAKEMSKVPARWDEIGKVVKLRDKLAPETIIVGNGDVGSTKQGQVLAKQHGIDGVMIGRGVFHNPAVFNDAQVELSRGERLKLLLFHLDLHQREWQGIKRFEPLKKFFKIYVNGFEGAAKLRADLMEARSYDQAKQVTNNFLKQA